MSAIRDLRDLVNVSRLTFREDSSGNESDTADTRLPNDTLKKNTFNILSNKSKSGPPLKLAPIVSQTTPAEAKKAKKPGAGSYVLASSMVENVKSSIVLTARASLLDRNVVPMVVPVTNDSKNPAPPPTGGNFDSILAYIDASVVSDWLNRANRNLKKMYKWHSGQDGGDDAAPSDVNKWLKYDAYVKFCNFWLGFHDTARLTDKQRRELVDMEYSIVYDEVLQAFQVGVEAANVSLGDIHNLLKAVFREYPLQLLSFRGTYLLLDYIDVLSSERQDDYKKLLSDVKCRTVNKQYAQWLLSIRSFALINLCWSIVKFYRNTIRSMNDSTKPGDGVDDENDLADKPGSSSSSSVSSSNSSSSSNHRKRASARPKSSKLRPASSIDIANDDSNIALPKYLKYELYLEAVIKNDFPDVLHYLITTKKVDPYKVDEHGRTLVFLSVMYEKPKTLRYLLKRWPTIDVNEPCDSGNTPLHTAVNKGNLELVEALLDSINFFEQHNEQHEHEHEEKANNFLSATVENDKTAKKLDVNKINEKCMNATPLHLAVWNSYNEIALKLVEHKADPYLKMNGLSNAFDLALDNSNLVLHELLTELAQR